MVIDSVFFIYRHHTYQQLYDFMIEHSHPSSSDGEFVMDKENEKKNIHLPHCIQNHCE